MNGTTDVTRNITWLDDAVSQVFHLENLPIHFMPASNNDTEGEQQIVRFLLVDGSADFWQSDPEPENGADSNGDGHGNPGVAESSNGAVPGHSPTANNGTSTNPPAVVAVEQNLARLAIVNQISS
jgi:hypothetical protein